jgi:hypothetical protein
MTIPDAFSTGGLARAASGSGGALERFEDGDGFVGYRSPLLAGQGIPHLFTTRLLGRRRELDLGRLDAEARTRVARAAGMPAAPILAVKQVHGACVLSLTDAELAPETEADGLVSVRTDALIAVHVADCVPILLARADGGRVAAVHAGWRGLVAGVIPRALRLLGAGRILAAIGPCISAERFEVGPEVERAFEHAGLAPAIRQRPGQRACIDLRAAAELELRSGGVALVDAAGPCTYDHPEEFYSYRRDVTHGGKGRTGRLGALIAAAQERRAAHATG